MDETGLDYPDEDDLDRMLDDELEIMQDIEESDRNKENEPARRSLSFASPFTNRKPMDGHVGIGLSTDQSGPLAGAHLMEAEKRAQSPEEDFPSLMIDMPGEKRGREEGGGGDARSPIRKRQRTGSPLTEMDQNTETRYRVPRLGERKIYRRMPDSDFIPFTVSSGERYYLRLRKIEELPLKSEEQSLQPVGLCGVPFHQLQEQALQETEAASLSRSKEKYSATEDLDSGIESGEEESTELWVEKFRPRTYMDLLSDDGTNRVLLLWLKLWDKLVYDREVPKLPPKPENEDAPKYKSYLPEVIAELDEADKPKQKIALLHGPPGLGKTTLAHIVARHAGYKVVEMNASDDRSVDAFKKNLEASTQMRSVLTGDQRPNCLIIDEIDGAPAATINYLVSVLTGKQQGKKKGSKPYTVLRPIICICNDLYTPALRPLKQLALVIPFPPTIPGRLAERLKEITKREKMKTDLTALLSLCKKTDNDIRSCLSTLQFFNRKGKVLRSTDIDKVNVGVKDTHKSIFSVWDAVFNIPSSDSRTSLGGGGGAAKGSGNNADARIKTIINAVASCGETEKIMTGVFENYLNAKVTGLDSVVKAGEWFTHFDILQHEIMHSQNYSTMGHLNYPIVAAHFLFGSVGSFRVSFPTQQTECRNKLQQNNNTIESIQGEMLPSTRAFCSRSNLVRDLLPYLLSVVQPSLRPVNTQLYSNKEKADLANLVNIHIAYNITYVQERNSEGQYEYKMDPDVESVVYLPEIKHPVQLTYGIKQLISHEIELEKMRRVDMRNALANSGPSQGRESTATKSMGGSNTPSRTKNPSGKQTPTRSKRPSGSMESPSVGSKTTTNHLAKLTPKQIVIKERQARDFFGRVIEISKSQQKAEEEKKNNEIVKTDIWFRFKEGYSNAVRRKVKIANLL